MAFIRIAKPDVACRLTVGLALWLLALPVSWCATLDVRVTDPQDRPLSNAVVTVDWPNAPAPDPNPSPAVMRQRDMTFVPHVLAIPVNTSVLFPNHDNTRHHVYSFSNAKTFDIKLYVGLPERPILFDKTGVVTLGCNIHDSMHAFIVVSDAPRMAVTNADGQVRFADVPARARTLRIWHEWLNIGDGGVIRRLAADTDSITVDIEISPPPAPPPNESMSLQQRFDRIAQ
ncbi:hypothetical protein T5B8_13213 [Salinisphaera sp. T5B8]|uniref:methylamine utilization protein n=1 Tax=Salinisphaera sp. T5B8 TaxID=1304154 RepID=UPI003340E58A